MERQVERMVNAYRSGRISRRQFIKALVAMGVSLSAVEALLAGCAPTPTPSPVASPTPKPTEVVATPTPAKRGGTLIVAFPGSPDVLDPQLVANQESLAISGAIYDNLVAVDYTLNAKPKLAESWEASEDVKTWMFKLRRGVRFHHGREFTADDVLFTFNSRILNPDFGSPARTALAFVDNVEKVDAYTVRFNLATANADLPALLGLGQARIVPADRTQDQFDTEPVGTGPFKLKEFAPGDHTTLGRNDDYWAEGLPYLDEVRFLYLPEQTTQIAALKDGSIHLMWQIGLENIEVVAGEPDIVVEEVRSGRWQPMIMQIDQPPFDDKRVRDALKYCADRGGIQKALLLGHGDLGNDHPISPAFPLWTELPLQEYNINKAKELLAEAGYPDGIDLELYTSTVRAGLVELATAFQEMARPAGVRIKINNIPADVYYSDYWLKVPFSMSNWGMRPTVDETLSLTSHSEAIWNECHLKSEEMDTIIEEARGVKDFDKRKEMYARAEEIIKEEGGYIITYFLPSVVAMRKEVKGFHAHPANWVDLETTWLEA